MYSRNRNPWWLWISKNCADIQDHSFKYMLNLTFVIRNDFLPGSARLLDLLWYSLCSHLLTPDGRPSSTLAEHYQLFTHLSFAHSYRILSVADVELWNSGTDALPLTHYCRLRRICSESMRSPANQVLAPTKIWCVMSRNIIALSSGDSKHILHAFERDVMLTWTIVFSCESHMLHRCGNTHCT